MAAQEPSKEERILRLMKRVLTEIAKETHAKPGFRHPLSDNTIQGMRECLALIAARERELSEARGAPMNKRPRFIDEPRREVVVPLTPAPKKTDDTQD